MALFMVLDDNKNNRDLLTIILKSRQHRVHVFDDSIVAAAYIHKNNINYDILFIDFLMPFFNGIEFSKYVRSKYIDTPIAILSAYWSSESRNLAKTMSRIEPMDKPIEQDKLFNYVDSILK